MARDHISNGFGDSAGKATAGIPGVHKKTGAGGAFHSCAANGRPCGAADRCAGNAPDLDSRCAPSRLGRDGQRAFLQSPPVARAAARPASPSIPCASSRFLLPSCARQRKRLFRFLRSQTDCCEAAQTCSSWCACGERIAFHGSTCIAPGTPRPSKLLFTASFILFLTSPPPLRRNNENTLYSKDTLCHRCDSGWQRNGTEERRSSLERFPSHLRTRRRKLGFSVEATNQLFAAYFGLPERITYLITLLCAFDTLSAFSSRTGCPRSRAQTSDTPSPR